MEPDGFGSRHKVMRFTSLVVAMLAVLASACGGSGNDTVAGNESATDAESPPDPIVPVPVPGTDLTAAIERWMSSGIETYHYDVSWSHEPAEELTSTCVDQSTLTVQVVDGSVISAQGRSGCVLEPDDPGREPLTAEEWFEYIKSVGDESDLEVVFSEVGFPIRLYYSPDGGLVEASISDLAVGVLDRPDLTERETDFSAAQLRWEESGLASYNFRIVFGCFCDPESLGPYEVQVRDGVVSEIVRDGESVIGQDRANSWQDFFTVPGLFDEVERVLTADELTITYDSKLGFPASYNSNPDIETYDDELEVTVTDFVAVADPAS